MVWQPVDASSRRFVLTSDIRADPSILKQTKITYPLLNQPAFIIVS